MRGDEDDRALRVRRANSLEEIKPGAVGQLQVEDDDVRVILLNTSPALRDRPGREHFHILRSKDAAERVANDRFIVNQQ